VLVMHGGKIVQELRPQIQSPPVAASDSQIEPAAA